jgi:uncharacterized protein (TIGR03437 family)
MTARVGGIFLVILAAPLATGQTADEFFNDASIHEIRLDINPADWNRLKAEFRSNDYYPVVFRWRNVVLENIGIRSSGLGSRSPIKPNLRVDFDRFEEQLRFLGLRSVKLDANSQDPSQMRERLTMRFFERLGLPASRETHARLFVNGQLIGLYAVVESVDKNFLKLRFNEEDGYLYEYNYAFSFKFEYLGSDPARYSPVLFDPKTHEVDPDPRPIEAWVRTVNQASDGDFERAAGEYIDLRKFLTHVAAEQYMAETDGILGDLGMANFYVYRFQRTNRHQFLVWDKDNTFSSAARDILRNAGDNILMRRTLAVPALRNFFLGEVVRAASVAGGPGGWLDSEIDRIYNQVRQAALDDPNKQCPERDFQPGTGLRPCTNEDFERGVENLRLFSWSRGDYAVGGAFAAGYLPPSGSPRLSDGGAVNAASNRPGLSPGSLASIYGTGLATETRAATALPLPTEMGGVTILINGRPAPLLFVSPGQINLQVPWETNTGNATIAGLAGGIPGNSIRAEVRSAAPGIFVLPGGAGVVTRPDNSLITAELPAAAGDVLIIYATGLGPVTQRIISGAPAPPNPLAGVRDANISVRFGDVAAQEVFFAGLTPGFVGLYQVNVRVPPGIPAGASTPLTVSAGSEASAPVSIATR